MNLLLGLKFEEKKISKKFLRKISKTKYQKYFSEKKKREILEIPQNDFCQNGSLILKKEFSEQNKKKSI